MFPATSPVATLSRSRLKALSIWVRDELDQLVAREGPNVLRPDDVLILHETFIALYHATEITALDLRATGIHRAVQDISGVATRWPSRLCDDCDKIITLWTAKFGTLNDLHPFLYGRGGRLEGIASATEYTREALLKRWSENCPDKLHPKVSHRIGDLGFRPGDWWINTLFAHHAGIIGREAVEGGTTFDKHGAYALVLKDTGEVEACHGDAFTYRCPQWDRGKFHLTAATPRSRDPVRVLRSHSINSVWGPKAGVRYEGLYRVKGWSIRQAKSTDTAGGLWKEGDIIYEVDFERSDPHPMGSFSNRPTATEVDDYTEYKRLRKLYREGKRDHLPGVIAEVTSLGAQLPPPVKAAPPIPPPTVSLPPPVPMKAAKILDIDPPNTIRKNPKHPHFDIPSDNPLDQADVDPLSPVSEASYFPPQPPPPRRGSTLAVHAFISRHFKTPVSPLATPQGSPSRTPGSVSPASSIHSDLREVAPWVDLEAPTPSDHLPPPLPAHARDSSPRKDSTIPHSGFLSLTKKKQDTLRIGTSGRRQSTSPTHRERRKSGGDGKKKKDTLHIGTSGRRQSTSPIPRERRKSGGDVKKSIVTLGLGVLGGGGRARDGATTTTAAVPAGPVGPTIGGRRSIVARSRNPIAKLLDGAEDQQHSDETEDLLMDVALDCASEEESIERVASPVPMRVFSIDSPFASGRRRGIYSISEKSGEDEDPFVDEPAQETCEGMRGLECREEEKRFDEIVGGIVFQELAWEREKEKRMDRRGERLSVDSGVAPDEGCALGPTCS